jgi:hypothetical protein
VCILFSGLPGEIVGTKTGILLKCSSGINKDLYDIFGELSRAIHGAPWSGPSVNVKSTFMTKEAKELIICLAESLSFGVTER